MNILFDALAAVFLLAGLFFMFVGALGIVRLPDTFLRLHAASKCSTLGLIGLLLAAVFHLGTGDIAAKSLATLVFAFVATPVGSHLLAKAALRAGTPTWDRTLGDEHAEDGLSQTD